MRYNLLDPFSDTYRKNMQIKHHYNCGVAKLLMTVLMINYKHSKIHDFFIFQLRLEQNEKYGYNYKKSFHDNSSLSQLVTRTSDALCRMEKIAIYSQVWVSHFFNQCVQWNWIKYIIFRCYIRNQFIHSFSVNILRDKTFRGNFLLRG